MKLSAIGLLSALLVSSIPASAWSAGSAAISVTLSPAGSFVARSAAVQGTAQKAGADSYTAQNVTLELNTLKTGIDLRDRHMSEKYFETQKYPRATLKSGKAHGGKFEGDLEVHGKVKKVSGSYEAKGGSLVGKFKTALSDYGIAEARYMGVGVEDEVEVEVTLPIGAAAPAAKPAAAPAKPAPAKAPGKKPAGAKH